MTMKYIKLGCAIAVATSGMVACGGGGGDGGGKILNDVVVKVPDPVVVVPLPPSSTLKNQCLKPRSGTSDLQGTMANEKAYLRSFTDETYLWYKDIPTVDPLNYADPQKYFLALKTPAKTPSGKDLDRFHWSVTEEEFNQQTSGIEEGYAISWARAASSPPRNWVVSNTEPSGPGGLLQRGDKLISVDGEDFINGANVNVINEGLFPTKIAPHTFELMRAGQLVKYTLTPALISTTPVRYTKVVNTPTGRVGYVYFDDHIAKSEDMLIKAFKELIAQGAQDLVLDLRYNGGGLLYISNELAYMIGGSNTDGKTYNRLVYNDKLAPRSPTPFYNTSTKDEALPTLNLKRVTILVGSGTASASEAIINGLRGVDIDVTLIGNTTVGKPYGFSPQANCGHVYYTVQFKNENAKSFSDFADGFKPTCEVNDDFTKALGDPAEKRFAAALEYRNTKTCPAPTGVTGSLKSVGEIEYKVTPNPSKFLMIPN
jgi:carboxyl-terminal processing protease